MMRRFTSRFSRPSVLRQIALTLIIALLVLPVSSTLVASAKREEASRASQPIETIESARRRQSSPTDFNWLFRTSMGKQSKGMPLSPPSPMKLPHQRVPSKAERELKIYKLEMNFKDNVILESGQRMLFTAIPVDIEGNAIHGFTSEWESTDPRVISINVRGEAIAHSTGTVQLTATAGNKKERINVTVIPQASLSESIALKGRERQSRAKSSHLQAHGKGMPAPLPPQTIPNTELGSLYEPSNNVGTPPGKTVPGALTPAAATGGTEMPGSSNFNFAVPLLGLPGRGVDVGLSLVYNSLLWNKSGSTRMTYDYDGGWPAPGFRIGYGQLSWQFPNTNRTLTDPDGTRHELVSDANQDNFYSTDGTFIRLSRINDDVVTYPDGTQITYGASRVILGTPKRFFAYPTKITDANGNYILISY